MLKPLQSVVQTWAPAGSAVPGRSGDPLQSIVDAWPAIVGETVARNSAPLELGGRTLVVATRSSAWSQQLQFLSETILAEIAALAGTPPIDRLAFRSGRLRAAGPRGRFATGTNTPSSVVPFAGRAPGPAVDEREAFERLRRRVTAVRRAARTTCAECAAPLSEGRDCAPCRGEAERARRIAAQRLMYSGASVDFETTRLAVPGLTPDEYDAARRHLLRRWREMLERARRRNVLCADGMELRLADSYVLLQSRLPPERISAAIVRNALGDPLYAFLYEREPRS
jgi:hypothetical protein